MNFPLFPMGYFTETSAFAIAVLTGIAFGFVLERGGLGNALKLSGQFYLKDLTVFKVMFTAILTAMFGLFWLGQAGVVDLTMVYFSPSYLVPQALAGILFGFGFIMAGLCPGTSCVAAATGKLDGLVVMSGILIGVTVFAGIFPAIENVYYATSIGQVTLPQILRIKPGLVVVLVILIAVAGFYLAERIEGKKITLAGKNKTLIGMLSIVILIPPLMQEPMHYQIDRLETRVAGIPWGDRTINGIGVHELADMIIGRQDSVLIIDLRSSKEYDMYHIPGAVVMNQHGGMTSEKYLILVSNYGDTVPLSLMRNNDVMDRLFILKGGMKSWKEKILFPDLTWTSLSGEEKKKAVRVSRYFGGDPLMPRTKPGSPGSKYVREGC